MDPGCQADHMLIFEGKQGVGKSQAARILGGQFYVEYSGGVKGAGAGAKDMVAVIVGKLVIEMSELATLRRADMESLKAIITTPIDEVRLSYERDAKSYPRTGVFLGTTNEVGSQYIMDVTGARRFWPTVVGEAGPVRTAILKQDVDQLWAEAVEAYEAGEDWYTIPTEEVAREQADRQLSDDSDPWFGLVRNALTDGDNYPSIFTFIPEFKDGEPTGEYLVRVTSVGMLLGVVIGLEASRQSINDDLRIRKILKAIGFVKRRPSKPWNGSTYALDISRDAMPHLWPTIKAIQQAQKFPMKEQS